MFTRSSTRFFAGSFTSTSCKPHFSRQFVLSNAVVRPIVSTPLFSNVSARAFSVRTLKMAQEFKLKGVDKLDLKDLDKAEYEVEGIEGGKVLLCNVNGQVHALNANCTHYGAPLKNGVLTPEGRLTCPWHGGKYRPRSVGEEVLMKRHSLFQCQERRCRRLPRTSSAEQIRRG
jgi:nitrite reductase/ring-hydroxylating ferredoxin subunit